MTPQELGTKLKQARESVGMSQADVANALNLTRTAITRMENAGHDNTERRKRGLSFGTER